MIKNKIGPGIHLNLNVRGLSKSATLAINELGNSLIREGRRVYKLGFGQSPFPVPPSIVTELQANAHQKDYLPVLGLEPLRKAVAGYYRRTQSLSYSHDNILIGPGSKELMFLLQFCYCGDLVLPSPSWVSYAPQAAILGRRIHWLPTYPQERWCLKPEALDTLCAQDPERPRLVVLNYPSNPAGTTYSTDELRNLAEVARKYNLLLLSDEIYGEFHFAGPHISIAQFYPEGTIISGGLSKWCGAGGWRLGTFAFPKALGWLKNAMCAVASETYTSVSAPIQYAAIKAFEGSPEIEEYLVQARRVLKALGEYVAELLQEHGVKVVAPAGAFYLFPDFSSCQHISGKDSILSSQDLCNRILKETGVALLPGSDFGRPADEWTARLAYVNFDGAEALAGVSQIPSNKPLGKDFLETYCSNCLQGVRSLCEWLGGKHGDFGKAD
ncbi:MAG: aspartate aminotransferase [Elusimicrobia bacterium RIFOXYB2_FULL_49_7]|nr:MAG: aspartate aminotransferase [Elusimicrobia bacterium RIFOXYB2_FULL_49_7]